MTKDELIAFLQENLTIEVDSYSDWYTHGISVKLNLCGKTISEGEVSLGSK